MRLYEMLDRHEFTINSELDTYDRMRHHIKIISDQGIEIGSIQLIQKSDEMKVDESFVAKDFRGKG